MTTRAPRTFCATALFACLSAFALVGGCSQEIESATQIVLVVDSDLTPGTELTEIAIELRKADGDTTGKVVLPTAPIAAGSNDRASGKLILPISLSITQGSEEEILISVVGSGVYGETKSLRPLVTQRAIMKFSPHRTQLIRMILGRVCVDHLCDAAADSVCYPVTLAETSAGECGSISPLTDSETLASVDPHDVTGMVTQWSEVDPSAPAPDASTTADAAPPQTPAAPPPMVVQSCATENVCATDYPCLQTTPESYTCRGQFADWPMPDAQAGAKFPPRYDYTTTPGVVMDQVTGLHWQREIPQTYTGCTRSFVPSEPVGNACDWEEAKRYCEQLVLSSRDDWRLPTRIELESIVDDTRANPAIDPLAFPATPARWFWTSSRYSRIPQSYQWTITFHNGRSDDYAWFNTMLVRCVR